MDLDYEKVKAEILQKTQDPDEMDRLMHEYHNERIAELIRTKETWLDKLDKYPIEVNQFNQITAGNHRFRAVRFLELDEVEVTFVQGTNNLTYYLPDIWDMTAIPPKILRAALYTLYQATVFSRNYVKGPHGQDAVYDLMDAVHEVPQILLRWGTSDNDEQKLKRYLGYFNSRRVREQDPLASVPDLVALYEQKLREE